MTTGTAVSTYGIDAIHSTAEFAIKHMMVATVKGSFRKLDGVIRIDEEDPTRSFVEASIDTSSVDTGVEMRDNDLRSANFFDAEHYPAMRFRSTRVDRVDEDNWSIRGELTIRDVTREVVLETEFEGRAPGMDGNERIGFTAQTTLNRRDFGLNYNAVLETGGVVVGDKVKVTLHIEAVKQ